MSFILDALKKSENERQRQSGPAFAEVPVAQPRSGQPWWVLAIGALLLVNLLVLLYVVFGREPASPVRSVQNSATPTGSMPATNHAPPAAAPMPATAAPVTLPPPAAPSAATPTPSLRGTDAPVQQESGPRTLASARAPSLAEAAGVANPYESDDPTLDYGDIDTAAAQVPDGPPIVQPLPQRAARDEAPAEALPTLNDLMLSGSTSLPELHLDIHVYAPAPAERFVFINMRKYVEGQKLQEGPLVERITRDGVVLNQQGLRFLLPSQ